MLIFNAVIPTFLIIALGYYLKKVKFVDERVQDFLNNLAYNLILPCMIFGSIYKLPFKEVFDIKLILGMYSASFIVFLLCMAAASLMDPFKRGSFLNSSFRTNIVYIGFPIMYGVYGATGLGKLSVITGFIAPVTISLAILYLKYWSGLKVNDKNDNPFSFLLKDPLIAVSIISVLVCYYQIKVPKILGNTVELLAAMGSPMMLIAVGAGLNIKKVIHDRVVIGIASFIKLFLLPLITFLVLKYAFKITAPESLGVGTLTFAFSTALASHVIVKKYGSDAELTAATITVTTILSMFTISGWIYFLTGGH